MMLMPSIFGEKLFDDFMDFPFRNFSASDSSLMKTDIKEAQDGYELDIDLPGFKKEDIKAELKNGYLNISAVSDNKKDEKDKDGRYIRRERYCGSCSRNFYVGEGVTEEEIKAKFEDGILKLYVPKAEAKAAVEEKKYIAIEG